MFTLFTQICVFVKHVYKHEHWWLCQMVNPYIFWTLGGSSFTHDQRSPNNLTISLVSFTSLGLSRQVLNEQLISSTLRLHISRQCINSYIDCLLTIWLVLMLSEPKLRNATIKPECLYYKISRSTPKFSAKTRKC